MVAFELLRLGRIKLEAKQQPAHAAQKLLDEREALKDSPIIATRESLSVIHEQVRSLNDH